MKTALINNRLVSPYLGPEKNCGDRLKVILLQVYDMSDRHNLQIYEILSVVKSLTLKLKEELSATPKKKVAKAPKAGSSCGDDFKTKTKYLGSEKTLGNSMSVCESQIRDMVLIDHLDSNTIYFLIKDLVEAHIEEVDEAQLEVA